MAASTPPIPLDQVARRIKDQEAELKTLRKDYEAGKKRLEELTRRRQSLLTQLQQLDSQIAAYIPPPAPPTAAPSKPAAPPAPVAKVAPPAPAPATDSSLSVPQLMVAILEKLGRPLTNKELTEEVRLRRGEGTGDLLKQITTRVGEMVKKGLLRRTNDGKAVRLPGSAAAKPAPVAKPTPPKPAEAPKAAPQAPKPAKTSPTPGPRGKDSLEAVLTRILEKSAEPVNGTELARRAQAAGYQSKSKDFPSVVWVMLGKMDNVENIRGQGYRLKKRSG